MLLRAAAVALVLAAPAAAGPCPAPAVALPADVDVGRFHLQSRFWMNLHQRLLYATRFESTEPAGLTAAEHAAWDAAVSAYKPLAAGRLPFADAGLMAIDAALAVAAGDDLSAIPPAYRDALRAAAPLYRKRQWGEDDGANRFWISVAAPQLSSLGEELVCAHERVYGRPMPRRIHVDVASHAWQFGAYTTGDVAQSRTVLSSRTRGYEGLHVAEMIFHEASHAIVDGRRGAIGDDIMAEARELNVDPPPNLWHALQFVTSGELARRALAARGFAEYAPVSSEMFDRAYTDLKDVVPAAWGPVLDGTVTRAEAIRAILRAKGKPRP